MKKLFVILAVIISCTTKKPEEKAIVPHIEVNSSGITTVTTEYADSITVVTLNKEGEVIQLSDSTLLDTIRDSSFLYKN